MSNYQLCLLAFQATTACCHVYNIIVKHHDSGKDDKKDKKD